MKILILEGVVANGNAHQEGAEIEVSAKDGEYLIQTGKAMEMVEQQPIEQPKVKRRGRPPNKRGIHNGS
jgi:hypothetical protein